VIEKALENVEVTSFWDGVGGSAGLAELLATKGVRATGVRAFERLKELWRSRNHLAHSGDGEVALSEAQLREALISWFAFSDALDQAVKKQLKRPLTLWGRAVRRFPARSFGLILLMLSVLAGRQRAKKEKSTHRGRQFHNQLRDMRPLRAIKKDRLIR
jgi:hypothetical protein